MVTQKSHLCVTTRAGTNGRCDASAWITTDAVDRDGDTVHPEGIDLSAFRKNPVVLFAHDYSDLPVAKCTDITVGKQGLRASWDWLKNDDRADRVRNAWDQGFLNATSIGFRPIDSVPSKSGGRHFKRCELLEFSIVPVPANASALRGLQKLGLDWIDFDERDLAEAVRSVVGEAIAIRNASIRQQTDDAVRRFIAGDRSAHHHGDVSDKEFVRSALKDAVATAVKEVVARETASTLRRMSGRLD